MVRRIEGPSNSSLVKIVDKRDPMQFPSSSPVRTRVISTAKISHNVGDETRDIIDKLKNAKPSEIRAASKAGRATVKAELEKQKAEREKQQRLLKEQQRSHMKMNKIIAEIEAIKQSEGKEKKCTQTESIRRRAKKFSSSDGTISSMEKVSDNEKDGKSKKYEELRKQEFEERKGVTSGEKKLLGSSNVVTEMRRKPSKWDSLSRSGQLRPTDLRPSSRFALEVEPAQLRPIVRSATNFRRSGGFPIIQGLPLAKKEGEKQKVDGQRKKLEEAKGYFEEGYQLCWRFQDSRGALVKYRKALLVREGIVGKYHEETGRTYYWIGRSHCKLREHDDALVALSRALRIFVRVLTQNHKYLKWTETAIAEAYNTMDSPDVDCEIYKASLYDSIGHEMKGDDYRNDNLFAQAITEYRAAIETIQYHHPDCADLHSKIAIILCDMGKFEKAFEEDTYALEIYELTLGSEHPETVKTLNRTKAKKRLL